MHRFYFLSIFFFKLTQGFHLEDNSEDRSLEGEPCNAGCKNGGQCFLSAFCICPKGFTGRYCEISLNEQCGTFASMTKIEIDCVLCICYNGLFVCDVQPVGLCRHKGSISLTRSMRINRALNLIQYRFKNIRSFERMRQNITFDRNRPSMNLAGYKIILNESSFIRTSSFFLLVLCLWFIYVL